MSKTKILKLSMVIVVSLSFLFTFSFIAACGGAEPAEEVMEEEPEEEVGKIQEETVEEPEEEVVEEPAEEKVEEEVEEPVEEEVEEPEEEVGGAMIIESPSFANDEMIPSKYTCDAENINPALTISGVPGDAESLVLIVDDPDAPGKTWVHWTLWNIDPGTIEIPENGVPSGVVEGVTDFGTPGYGGPCPPSGTHRYFFKLYALDITLEIDASSSVGDIEAAMEGHMLSSTELVGLYQRG